MKILTIAGTRPELIRLSQVIPLLDKYCDHTFIHTGQNYDPKLKDIFFHDLNIRDPDYTGSWWTGDNPSFSRDINNVMSFTEEVIQEVEPDKLLVLGDTNSGLSAIIAKKYGIKVYHMEAGNRCFDDKVPEEVNRRIIDSCSDVLMPYTERSRQNLLHEGYHSSKIFVTGNPINEVIGRNSHKISNSDICERLHIDDDYFLVTMHRSENVDNPMVLENIMNGLFKLADENLIIISTHPHTRKKLKESWLHQHQNIKFMDPFGFFDFVHLELNAKCVISDSGTVQEECCILDVPNITIRTTTERPETIECGSNILTGYKPDSIINGVKFVTQSKLPFNRPPPEYTSSNVSGTVLKIILGVT